jgi:adenine-specific DNA methylase
LIRKVYHGIFRGKKIVDNRISAHATRLIANAVIAYNSMMLNDIYLKMQKANATQSTIERFARISPIAWVHILFTGRYSFKKIKGDIDIAGITAQLERQLKQSFWFD